MAEKIIDLENTDEARTLFGAYDSHLKRVRETLGVQIVARNRLLRLSGTETEVERAADVFEALLSRMRQSGSLTSEEVDAALSAAAGAAEERGAEEETLLVFDKKRIRAKTLGQQQYLRVIRQKDVVLCVGPAGTGKTYLAVAAAMLALRDRAVERIVLCRPAVEAGERLGFLPGDIESKVNPYLRPLYDALLDIIDTRTLRRYLDEGLIEIAPLAYMRGRTLNRAFVILDEGQNCTVTQMKTFLTRLGIGSKAVITGDITQIDLAEGQVSGLVDAFDRLQSIAEIGFVRLSQEDIVRHRLVHHIVSAYEETDSAADKGGAEW